MSAPKICNDSEHKQALKDLRALIQHLRKLKKKTVACKCSGRMGIEKALEMALHIRNNLQAAEGKPIDFVRVASVIVFLWKFVAELADRIPRISNDYQFPEDYEYRVDHKKAA